MNLFLFLVNNKNMKKILIFLLLFANRIYALEDIKINNSDLIPKFSKNIKVYNYYTNNSIIDIKTKNDKNEITNNEGIYEIDTPIKTIIIKTSNNEKYTINVFKDYDKNRINKSFIEDISINGYDLNYNKDIHEYKININDEDNLIINYELSNYDDNVKIIGNGNFNKTDNIIKIILNNKEEYIIHALKSINVSSVEKEELKEMSYSKKEIVKLIIITISCILIFMFYYVIFINKKHLYI